MRVLSPRLSLLARIIAYAACLCALLLCIAPGQASLGTAAVDMTANPSIVLADGRSTTTITVTLNDGSGRSIADGTQVHFSTTSGTLDPTVAISTGGVVRTNLTSSPIAGHATVSASFIGPNGGANGTVVVEFTADSDLANTDQISANWIRVTSPEYLAYGADFKTIDAAGRANSVKIAYRGLAIAANAAQVDLQTNTVRAQSAILTRGSRPPLHVDSLFYMLDSHSGTAMIVNAPGHHTVEQVHVDGLTLATTPYVQPAGQGGSQVDYDFKDLSQGHVLITAAAVSVQPRQQIQLARATIYIDGKKIVTMPNQVMPLETDQIFGKQILGYGTDGVYVDVPYYSSVSPTSTGMFSLRSTAAANEAGTYYSGRGPIALDYDRTYTGANKQGDLKFIGMSSADWGVRWTQTQKFAGGTQGYLYVDSPMHRSIYSSLSLRHDYGAFSMNVVGTDSTVLGHTDGTNGHTVNVTLDTPERMLFGGRSHGLHYSEEANLNQSAQRLTLDGYSSNNTDTSHSFGFRFDTPPITPDRRTSITDSVNLEQDYSDTQHYSTLNIRGDLQVSSQLTNTINTSLGYNFTHDPQVGPSVPIIAGSRIISLYNPTDTQSFTFGLSATPPTNHWSLNLTSTYGLPTQDVTLGGGLTYRLSSQMHLGVDNYYSHLDGYDYRDTDFSISHRIGSRDLVVTWSTYLHEWRFNIAPAQF